MNTSVTSVPLGKSGHTGTSAPLSATIVTDNGQQYLPCPRAIPHGFVCIDIPPAILRECQIHILKYFTTLDSSLKQVKSDAIPSLLTQIASSYSDEEFVKVFIKGQRTFPSSVSKIIAPWIESEIKPLLQAKRVSLTHVSDLDQCNNSNLSPNDYDIYWRCVRPRKQDVARPHKDSQFAYLNEGSARAIPLPFEIRERWRIWFPLFGCHMDNSIQLVKDSYKEEIPFSSIETVNGPRPDIEDHWVKANETRFGCPIDAPNRGVLFRDDVVHRGPVNPGPHVRISAEFTLVIQ